MNNNSWISDRPRVAVVGRGNIGFHLGRALEPMAEVCLIDSRSLEGIDGMFDVILIAVSDKAIADVAARIPRSTSIVAHTSGSTDMAVLAAYHERFGVFYPLQTFSKEATLDYSEIPVFIEGNSETVTNSLKELAGKFSDKIYDADSDARRSLHLASVFACNFTNHMYGIACRLLQENGLPQEALNPLIAQTVAKIRKMTPDEAQTGPASRNDTRIVERHIEMLEKKPLYKKIYADVSESIMKSNKKN